MTTTSVIAGVFLDPPVNIVARYPAVPLIGTAVLAVASAIAGVVYTRRTRSPLYFWAAVSGLTLFPLLVEPSGDIFSAVWYPTNLDIVATVFDRPMPWFAVLFYGAGIPALTVSTYEIIKRGLPASRLLLLLAALAVAEIPMEMLGSHFQWMNYYGNHAVLGGVPIYCFVQNAGMFAVVAWVLSWLMPHIRGWRWVLVPFALAASLPAFAIITTFPAYIAIATHASAPVGWVAGIVSAVMNAAVVVACIYSPPLRRMREAANASPTTAVAPVHA